MKEKGWQKYWLWSLPREQRAEIIRQDARHESAFVRQCTEDALATDSLDKPKDFDDTDDSFNF
jgi:hypothetical protein